MKQINPHFHFPSRSQLFAISGGLSIAGLIVAQIALGGTSVTVVADDDGGGSFPSGTGGGGTHWVLPDSYTTL